MSGLTEEQFSSFQASLNEQLEAVTQCFSLCFDDQVQWSIGEPLTDEQREELETLDGPGFMACFTLSSGEHLLVILPDDLLPEWYVNPDENQAPRLQNLAFEWSMCLVPEELQGEENTTRTLPNLKEALAEAQPSETFHFLPVTVNTESGEQKGQLYLAMTTLQLPTEPERPEPVVNEEEAEAVESHASETEVQNEQEFNDVINRVRRLMPLTVPVSVHLAHKRIELKQLMSIAPGTLIVFNKSCEDLLDLYVKDQLYARGEAVKIGEKFGLKINEVGAKVEREPGIFNL